MNFYDKDGYELIMMAKISDDFKEIRVYAINDITAARE
jgi:hypothetical protein